MDESSVLIKRFFSHRPTLFFKRGEILIREGDPISRVYWIKKGFVRLYELSESGSEISLHIYQPCCFIPATLGLGESFMPYTFVAMTDVQAQCAVLNDFMKVLEKNPALYLNVIHRNARMMRSFFQRMEIIFTRSAYQGVAYVLSRFVHTFGCMHKRTTTPVQIPMSHQEIATWINATRETVSRQIQQLKKEGIITTANRHITIINPRKLSQIVSGL